ncbi:pseudouridine synthase [Philodulcilactobacillus myokoensis]|uniref:Pseudouridine synthase n=2 Tax=Philodulcilactobacillus myokoensis TaxID=2929573 RepID=A0A9W6ESH0_9LACO|nr:pseudouridine synthase [Philodulcilactobacillus myokoensis]
MVNREPQFPSYFIHHNDLISVYLPKENPNRNLIASHQSINVIFENNNFLVVNKPPYLHSMPSAQDDNDSLINRVKGYLIDHHLSCKTHIVTRLDGDTSGIVIFAKHHYAHSILDYELKHHQLKKYYIAVVCGHFSSNHYEIDLPIERDQNSYIKRKIDSNGKFSKTEFWVLRQNLSMAVIKVCLHTGRTHQIRVHLSAIGHPLVGDWLYNPSDKHLRRQGLHCFEVKFNDPLTNQFIQCHSNLPFDIQCLINKI